MTCEKCGATLQIGQHPWCPHEQTHLAVQSDELFNFKQENFGNEPEYFTSRKAMLRRADELNLRQTGDCDLKRGGYGVTAKTLDDARVLLTRGSQTADTVRCETASFTVRDL